MNGRARASITLHARAGDVELSYARSPQQQPVEHIRQSVQLERTPCTLGGSRPWFLCPACNRRVAVLYGAGRLFACRRCEGLPYASQREGDDDRAARRANRIRKRLGWAPGIFNPPGAKPKGMHWRTFQRLVVEHDTWVASALAGLAKRLGLVDRLLGEAHSALDRER